MTDKRKHHIYLILMFGAYIFLHTTILLLANRESRGFINAELEENLYYIHMVFMILGLSSLALIKRIAKGKTKIPDAIALALLISGTIILYTVKKPWVFVGIGSMSVFCLGYLGAVVSYRMSMETATGRRTGLVMGIGCAVAYTLQYFFEGNGLSPVLPVIIAVALAAFGYVLLRQDEAQYFADNGNAEKIGKKIGHGLCLCLHISPLGF